MKRFKILSSRDKLFDMNKYFVGRDRAGNHVFDVTAKSLVLIEESRRERNSSRDHIITNYVLEYEYYNGGNGMTYSNGDQYLVIDFLNADGKVIVSRGVTSKLERWHCVYGGHTHFHDEGAIFNNYFDVIKGVVLRIEGDPGSHQGPC